MTFLMGESAFNWLERITYRGAIGFFYESTWGGIFAHALFFIIAFFAILGFIGTMKVILFGFKKKKKY